MTRVLPFVLLALLPATVSAQGRPFVEVGTNLGVTIQKVGGFSRTHFGIPGEGILGQPTLYASFFPAGTFMVEPQVALNVVSSGGRTVTSLGLGAQVGTLLKGPEVNSPFVVAAIAFQSVSGGSGEFALGGKAGYRIPVGTSFGVRFEGGFRRWFDSQVNEFSIGVGIGGVLRRAP